MSFKTPPLFDHYGDSDEDVEVFFVLEEKIISIQPSDENENFYQEQHVKEKHPFIDIHEEISCNQLADVFREDKRRSGSTACINHSFTCTCNRTFNHM
jgi:hypothetical protein